MKIAFLGTPAFAVPSLRALAGAGHQIAAVLCRPDKPSGRGMKDSAPPVKLAALELGLPVRQPAKLKDPELRAELESMALEAVIVVAYGLIVPRWVLELAPLGCVNVHGSILPLLRGAAPIQHAILGGFTSTGVSMMKLDAGMDTGPVYAIHEMAVMPDETAGELGERMARLAAELLPGTLLGIASGEFAAAPQDDARATYAPKIDPGLGALRWADSAEKLDRLIRGLAPQPGAFTRFRGRRVKLLRSRVAVGQGAAEPGTLHGSGSGSGLLVACGEGWLEVTELQPEGKRAMRAAEFAAGQRLTPADRFESIAVDAAGGASC